MLPKAIRLSPIQAMAWSLLVIALTFSLAGCDKINIKLPVDATPTSELVNNPIVDEATQVPSQFKGVCSYVWASSPLPDVSSQLTTAFRQAKMPAVEVEASAYGENCLDISTNAVVDFKPQQINFSILVGVEDLSDTQALGEWVVKILTVLETNPAASLPNTRTGQVDIDFQDLKKTTISLSFLQSRGLELIKQGLRGTSLLGALQQEQP